MQNYLHPVDKKQMAFIPAGEFIMGSEEFGPETPQRKVYLPDYYIDIYPVTNLEYKVFMDATSAMPPRHWGGFDVPKGFENHPVHRISWFEAQMYAEWAGKRLPSEAEWEKAARGTDGRRWPWGNEFIEDNALVWDRGEFLLTSPVDAHPNGGSPYGVFETSGNVEEWTADWYEAYPGSKYVSHAYGHKFKTLRGGSSFFTQNHARCAYRCFTRPEDSGIDNITGCGFRCVIDQIS
ncbi:MAG: SUMF1/EgtB/PvdO family nonheme iron enzyme [Anaerolineae bacterium]|jgi:formylglycine-generating enzyme required for sulfatase activity|nr:SUMF1/EgtB/PvdO family nonheme iron enzyme [Anaerolineae bacterium]